MRIRLDLPGFLRIRWCCDSPNPQTSAARERSEGAERLRSCRLLVCRGLQSYLLKLFSFHCEIPWLGSDYRTNKHKRTTRCLYPSCSFYELAMSHAVYGIRRTRVRALYILAILCVLPLARKRSRPPVAPTFGDALGILLARKVSQRCDSLQPTRLLEPCGEKSRGCIDRRGADSSDAPRSPTRTGPRDRPVEAVERSRLGGQASLSETGETVGTQSRPAGSPLPGESLGSRPRRDSRIVNVSCSLWDREV